MLFGGRSTLNSALHFLQNRTLPPSAVIRTPMRVALLHEPYKGKGIRYENEQVRRKAGKAVTK